MDAELILKVKAAAVVVFAGRPILAAYAHGSRVAGRPHDSSDLDIGCFLLPDHSERGLSIAEEMAMAGELSNKLGLEVDLRILDGTSLEVRGRVIEEGVRVYSGNDELRVGLERSTLSFYHDYKDVFRRMHEVRLEAKAKRGPV